MGKRSKSAIVGESGYARLEDDSYWTPSWCVDALMDSGRGDEAHHMDGVVWEPAVGTGRIAEALRGRSSPPIVLTSDIRQWDDYAPDVVDDFLAQKSAPRGVTTIITNPPYSLAEEFVRHALELMRPARGRVFMLLRNEWDSAESRRDLFLWPFARKIVLTRRPLWVEPKPGEVAPAPRHNFSWFKWDYRHNGPATMCHTQ